MLMRRITEHGGNDLRTTYRPCTINELLGNVELKKVLKNKLLKNKLDHTILFSGLAGTGKTTIARILALSLNCEKKDRKEDEPCLECPICISILNQNALDYREINVGADGGKDAVKDVVSDLKFSPFSARAKVIVFDEAHKLTTAAKDLLLKVMEDTASHVYIIFCTNKPEKLENSKQGDNPFLDRCEHYILKPLTEPEVLEALINIAQFEGMDYQEDVLEYIVELSKGIPRKAIAALSTTAAEGSWKIDNIKSLLGNELIGEDDAEIIELSRSLLKSQYGNSIELFEKLAKKYPVESIRVAVCGYVVSCLKRSRRLNESTKFSLAIDVLLPSIYTDNKPAQHDFYNRIYKVVRIFQNN